MLWDSVVVMHCEVVSVEVAETQLVGVGQGEAEVVEDTLCDSVLLGDWEGVREPVEVEDRQRLKVPLGVKVGLGETLSVVVKVEDRQRLGVVVTVDVVQRLGVVETVDVVHMEVETVGLRVRVANKEVETVCVGV